jgi:general stress protein 26
MLVTQHEVEPPRGRPMHVADVEDDGTVWFISQPDASLLAALESHRAVAIIAQGADQFVNVGGVAEVFQFAAKLRAIWKPSFERWFPEGPERADAVAIRVSLVRADRWDADGTHLQVDGSQRG